MLPGSREGIYLAELTSFLFCVHNIFDSASLLDSDVGIYIIVRKLLQYRYLYFMHPVVRHKWYS
jgi:hypothetical protein